MQMIAGIAGHSEIGQGRLITNCSIEINHGVINRVGAKPVVDGLPRRLVRHSIIRMPAEGRDRRAINAQAPRVRFVGEGGVSGYQVRGDVPVLVATNVIGGNAIFGFD